MTDRAVPAPPRVTIATVLYRPEPDQLRHWMDVTARTAAVAVAEGRAASVELRLGDCTSPAEPAVERVVGAFTTGPHFAVRYTAFDENHGHSKGTNLLLEHADGDVFWILNPDAFPAPTSLPRLLEVHARYPADVLDARQLPCEHPALYQPGSGIKSWASGAALVISGDQWRAVGGFDAEHFWSYCNDVDLSWRIRLGGAEARHVASAAVFHDKRVDHRGQVEGTPTQDRYGVLGRLMLARRYARPDIESQTIRHVVALGTRGQRQGVQRFRELADAGAVPRPIPNAHEVAVFRGGEYEDRRF